MSDTLQFLQQIHAADRGIMNAVAAAIPDIARAVDAAATVLDAGGRIYYCGAGTSGRLCVLDASELPPTFGVRADSVRALIAGGREAMFESREGAEDDADAGRFDLQRAGFCKKDALVGMAASGATPYVRGALDFARGIGSGATIAIVCTAQAPIAACANICIIADTGAEVLAGSTRMKAGTAQKVILQMFSTALMARRGLVYRGEMVAMRPTNVKLKNRALRIVKDLLPCTEDRARELLVGSRWDLPIALVAGQWRLDVEAAKAHLGGFGGNVARAMETPPPE